MDIIDDYDWDNEIEDTSDEEEDTDDSDGYLDDAGSDESDVTFGGWIEKDLDLGTDKISGYVSHPDDTYSQPYFAGYYNADGTYHYDSDNTDRDPETGAIVRRW